MQSGFKSNWDFTVYWGGGREIQFQMGQASLEDGADHSDQDKRVFLALCIPLSEVEGVCLRIR